MYGFFFAFPRFVNNQETKTYFSLSISITFLYLF